MLIKTLLLTGTLLASTVVNAQVFSRELGDFDLKLATQPTRSMAQGLVKPTSPGSTFHGGLDVTHESGTTAPGAGTSVFASGSFDLNATANTPQTASLVATLATRTFTAGHRLSVKYNNTIQSTAGVVVQACFSPI